MVQYFFRIWWGPISRSHPTFLKWHKEWSTRDLYVINNAKILLCKSLGYCGRSLRTIDRIDTYSVPIGKWRGLIFMSVERQFCNAYYNKFTKKVMDDFPKSSDVSKTTQRNPLEMSAYQYFFLNISYIDGILWWTLESSWKKRVCSNNR